jgi:hypothetical protein
MQDEVSKHTKKIYKTVKDPSRSFADKAKETIVEICIIVFAVSLSIWLHGWSEDRHERKVANAFLKGLKKDLSEDVAQLTKNRMQTSTLDSNYIFLASVKGKSKDTTIERKIKESLWYTLIVTRPNIGRYDGFKSSGKIETIENDSLKQDMLTFYQQIIPDLQFGENYTNSLQLKMLDLDFDRGDKQTKYDFVISTKMNSLFDLGSHNFEVNIKAYDKAIVMAKKVIRQIDQETK